MLVCVLGCGGPTQLISPTEAELAQEILPFHLSTAKPPPPPPAPKYFTHTISRSGETYMAIARWYTGAAANWQLIAQANPGIDPQYLRLGFAVRIPEEIMTTRQPMPKPKQSASKAKAAESAVAKTPAQPMEMDLYGPIEKPPAQAKPALATPELEPLE
jgi:nucleoid-associated protein YgaU